MGCKCGTRVKARSVTQIYRFFKVIGVFRPQIMELGPPRRWGNSPFKSGGDRQGRLALRATTHLERGLSGSARWTLVRETREDRPRRTSGRPDVRTTSAAPTRSSGTADTAGKPSRATSDSRRPSGKAALSASGTGAAGITAGAGTPDDKMPGVPCER